MIEINDTDFVQYLTGYGGRVIFLHAENFSVSIKFHQGQSARNAQADLSRYFLQTNIALNFAQCGSNTDRPDLHFFRSTTYLMNFSSQINV